MALVSQVVGHLSAAPAWLFFCQLVQFLLYFVIIRFAGLIAIRAAIQIYCSAGLPFAYLMLCDRVFDELSLLFRF
jgi:hypothetical protein